MLTHNEISLGQVNSELNTKDVVLELPVEIDVIAVFLQEIVLELLARPIPKGGGDILL
jgi:hypothetical protein